MGPGLSGAPPPSFLHTVTPPPSQGNSPLTEAGARSQAATFLPLAERVVAEILIIRDLTESYFSINERFNVVSSGPFPTKYFAAGAPFAGLLIPEQMAIFKVLRGNRWEHRKYIRLYLMPLPT